MRKRRAVLAALISVLSASLAHASAADTKPPAAMFVTTDGTIEANAYPVYQDLIGGTATDDASGVAQILVAFIPNGPGQKISGLANIGCSDDSMRSCMWRIVTPLVPGQYVVSARATDRAGNVQPVDSRVMIVVL